jgi:release factor glutamine methyltransferase
VNRPAAEPNTVTLGDLHIEARRRLKAADLPNPELDARLLVEHFSNTTRADAISRHDAVVAESTAEAVGAALARRLAGEPVHRILGFREFFGLKLELSPETLEPRPDTETLVDAVLPFLRKSVARHGACRILDLGTGTGAIALALLAEVEGTTATGIDISADALATASRNAGLLGLGTRFTALQSDWFARISGAYHAIVSNPPYIPSNELQTLQGEVRNFDPAKALDGGADGLDAYRTIAKHAKAHLEEGGVIAVEIGQAQRNQVEGLFIEAGHRLVEARCDLAGHDRVLVFDCN